MQQDFKYEMEVKDPFFAARARDDPDGATDGLFRVLEVEYV